MIEFISKYRNGFFYPADKYLKIDETKIKFNPKRKEYSKRLYLIFSQACNLKCEYCFQKSNLKPFKKINIDYILGSIENTKQLFDEIVFLGGEPFINDNLLIIKSILEKYPYKKFIAFTNANFEKHFLDLIVQNRCRFKSIVITFDGPEHIHNKRRKNPKGNSYTIAYNNLKNLIYNNVDITLQINLDQNNIFEIDELVENLSNIDGLKSSPIILNPVKYDEKTLTEEGLIKKYIHLKKIYKNVNIGINNRFLNNLMLMLSGNDIYYERCGLSTNLVYDFSKNIIYACPQNENTLIGKINNSEIHIQRKKFRN